MAETKRKFYNVGDAKGFTKAVFYKTVLDIVNGEDVSSELASLVAEAAQYELEGIANRPKADAGEKKDPLQSDYANSLRAAIIPLIDGTPRSAQELADIAASRGVTAPSGKGYTVPWIARVLNAENGIVCVKKVVEVQNAKTGLKAQKEVNAYKRG